jgi:hypothetical protein
MFFKFVFSIILISFVGLSMAKYVIVQYKIDMIQKILYFLVNKFLNSHSNFYHYVDALVASCLYLTTLVLGWKHKQLDTKSQP